MHNIPVYTDITHGNRQMTVIRKVEGDIWVSEGVGQGLSPTLSGLKGRESARGDGLTGLGLFSSHPGSAEGCGRFPESTAGEDPCHPGQ